MHRVLHIFELLRTIFDALIDDNKERTLVNVACTTKTFLEPALDSLWRQIDDLKIILKLLPADAITRDQLTKLYYVRRCFA